MSELSATIIIPAYNEEEAIGQTLEKLVELKVHEDHEIIVVDDGSSDSTAEIAAAYPVRLLRHHVNKGYGASLKTGIRKAEKDIVLFMDSDGQHDPADISRILEKLDEGYDMVSAIVGCAPDDLADGMPLSVEFHAVSDEVTLPFFSPS